MRRRREAIRARVKGDLPIVFTDEKLSAYGGIELLRRYLDRSGFCERLQDVFSIRQFDGDVACTAAKAVVTSVTKNLSLHLAKDEILVNTVSPGSFASPALRGWASSVGIDPDDLHAIMDGIEKHFGHPAHLPRAGDPAEIGPVIVFVASRRNSYMTGANINVDGGSDFT